jgi:hypothetical protein
MRGMAILEFVRDAVADEAARKRGFIEDCEKYAGGTTQPAERQRMCALEAATDALTYIIALGQQEKRECDADPRRRFPEWITRLAAQARNALIEPEPDIAEKEIQEG